MMQKSTNLDGFVSCFLSCLFVSYFRAGSQGVPLTTLPKSIIRREQIYLCSQVRGSLCEPSDEGDFVFYDQGQSTRLPGQGRPSQLGGRCRDRNTERSSVLGRRKRKGVVRGSLGR